MQNYHDCYRWKLINLKAKNADDIQAREDDQHFFKQIHSNELE